MAMAHDHLARLLAADKKDDDGAITAYRKVILLQPTNAEAHIGLGAALDRKRLLDEAESVFRDAIRLKPGMAHAHGNLAVVLSRKGLFGEAITAYHRAIDLQPNDASINNNVAWLLANCVDPKFRDPDDAVRFAKKAVDLAPNNGKYLRTLGTAYYRAGDLTAAVEAFTKSALLANDDGASNFVRAMAHWHIGEKEQARQWYERTAKWMVQNKPQDVELRRFRAEAAALLGLPDGQKE
jgi:Flp pilus assembly protein TadD